MWKKNSSFQQCYDDNDDKNYRNDHENVLVLKYCFIVKWMMKKDNLSTKIGVKNGGKAFHSC